MTKKDYVAIAAAIKRNSDPLTEDFGAPSVIVQRIAESIADVCASDNGRFDRVRFLAACGVKS